jgi:hypothetical protein
MRQFNFSNRQRKLIISSDIVGNTAHTMSTKRVVKKAVIDPKQGNIASLFGAKKAEIAAKKSSEYCPVEKNTILKSDDPIIQAFYDSLTPNERIAHEFAVEKLGTSYDVTRTRGFLKWRDTRAKST